MLLNRYIPPPWMAYGAANVLRYLEERHPVVENIVRLTVFDTPNATHTHTDLFQMDHGVSGRLRYNFAGRSIPTDPTLFFFAVPGRQHSMEGRGGDTCSYSLRFTLPGFDGPFLPDVLRVEPDVAERVRAWLAAADEAATAPGGVLRVSLLAAVALVELAVARPVPLGIDGPSPVVAAAIEYMERQFTQGVGVADVARHAGVSIPHLCRLFRRDTGLSPLTFLRRVRLGYALDLLNRSRLCLSDIAQAAGFDSAVRMTAACKSLVGMTAQEYRRRHGERNIAALAGESAASIEQEIEFGVSLGERK